MSTAPKPLHAAAPAGVQLAVTTGTQTLRDAVDQAVANYFRQLGEEEVVNVYDMVLAEVEAPLLARVLEFTRGNQTQAAIVLGLNRGTLRKKLKQYKLI
ncbi:MAG: DNA-binding transcriptional regulator Fis [Pseudomonadota bacterium]